MSDHDGLMRAILDDPDDETPRRVLADWFDDHGDPDRAKFVRTQLELDRLAQEVPYLDDWHWETLHDTVQARFDDWGSELAARIRAYPDLMITVMEEGPDYLGHSADASELLHGSGGRWSDAVRPLVDGYGFRRGLLERVRTTPRKLLDSADELFRAAPVLDVTLTDDDADLAAALRLPPLGRLTHLHIAGCEAERAVAEAVAGAGHLTRLTALWLGRCRLYDGGLAALAGCPHLAGLTELHLEGNGLGPAGLAALTASKHLKRLRTLSLAGARLGAEGARLLAAWPALGGLRFLDLSGCVIPPDGLAALAASPHLSGGLRTLILNRNDLAPESLEALAASRGLGGLQFLDLGDNRLGPEPEGVRRLVASDVASGLRYLGLAHCWLYGREAVAAIAASEHLGELNALNLSWNGVWAENVVALFSSPHLRLFLLDLSSNELDAWAMEQLPAEGASSPSTLLLNGNPLGDRGVKALAAWPGMRNVSQLELKETGVRSPGIKALLASPHGEMLMLLNVRGNRIGREGKKLLEERFLDGCYWVD